MDEDEHKAYHNLRDLVKDLDKRGFRLQEVLDTCYTFSNHYVAQTPAEEYNRIKELNYMTRNVRKYYERREPK